METAVAEREDELDGDLFDAGGAQLSDHGAERTLLGYLLQKPGAVTETLEILQPRDLHDPVHRRLYELLIQFYQDDRPISIETICAGLGGDKFAGPVVASLMADVDLSIDPAEIADHLWNISERRAVGSADDLDFDRGKPFVSKFGAQAWEEIGTGNVAELYPWLVEDILPLGEIAMAFGDTGTGKTFGVFDMAMCVARNIKFNGRNVEHGLVIYVAAEAGKGFAKRKVAYSIYHDLEPSEPLPFVLLTKRPNLFQDDTDLLALIAEIKVIKRRYRVPLVLIVVDTVSASTQGMDEISGRDQAAVRKRLLMLQDEFGASVLVVHHKPKSGQGPRGHGSQTADIETTVEFETILDKKTDDGKTIHQATVRKQREGKSGIAWQFTLPLVEIGKNKWGNPETCCAVMPHAMAMPKLYAVGFRATATERLFLGALYDALIEHGRPPPVGLPKIISKVVEQRHIRPLMRDRMIAPHEDSTIADGRFRAAFSRAGAKLRDGGVIGVQGQLLWLTGKAVQGFDNGRSP
jgi:AAA domain/DnaB-like helicase N terminal domain